jgi:hypothetical protein|uniref:Uncharacterized protein n=1 Tax=Mus musculus TaxID=10090 RepID=Q3USK9_MOUSE|nr:unnamed protein product [Mus musculus]
MTFFAFFSPPQFCSFPLKNLSSRHLFKQKNRLRVTSFPSLPEGKVDSFPFLPQGSKGIEIPGPGAFLAFILSALVGCNLISKD